MTRVLVTGSAQGLGHAAATRLLDDGHEVIVHLRARSRADAVGDLIQRGATLMLGDLGDLEQIHELADQVRAAGNVDAIIHNAGVLDGDNLLHVNVVAPYLLTALLAPPDRAVFLSSDMHTGGRTAIDDIDWSGRRSPRSYSDSKLYVTALSAAVARLCPSVLSNAVDPGWVPTRMGGRSAPDDLELGHVTQVWLATSSDADALTSGDYWYHQTRQTPHPAVHDLAFQDQLLVSLAEYTDATLS